MERITNIPLTINDIREWLKENASKYHQQKSNEFPPLQEDVFYEIDRFYICYGDLKLLLHYYKLRGICEQALKELLSGNLNDFNQLGTWAAKYEQLGSQQLICFDKIEYLWLEDGEFEVSKGIHTYTEPFLNMICFCRVFQLLYWEYELHKQFPIEHDKNSISANLTKILQENYRQ
ncbi:MAG: hypothetical protein K2X48_14210 [Chitinophagaceae bacterium]|nr:hypothetical protein [Chitinophagaceae bacterium]